MKIFKKLYLRTNYLQISRQFANKAHTNKDVFANQKKPNI